MRLLEPRYYLLFRSSLAASLLGLQLAAPSGAQDPVWRSKGPLCAGIETVAFAGSGSKRAYAATDGVNPALFVSTNNGGTWEKLYRLPYIGRIESLAVHPDDDRIVFLAGNFVLKSENRGRSWKLASNGLPDNSGDDLRIDPLNPRKMFLVSGERLYQSSNGGKRWRLAAPARSVESYVLHPRNPKFMWFSDDSGVSRSTDGGRSWRELDNPHLRLSTLAVDPTAATTVYAAHIGGLFKTTDGNRWDYLGRPPGRPKFLDVDPATSDLLLGATSEQEGGPALWRSTNGGRTWKGIGLRRVDTQSFARDPDNRKIILIGGRYGLFRSKRGGRSAKPANTGLHGATVSAFATPAALSPAAKNPISYAATYLCGLLSRRPGERGWNVVDPSFSHFDTTLAVSPVDPRVLYRGTDRSLSVSRNGGATWSSLSYDSGGQQTWDVAVSQADPMRVYAVVDFAGLYLSRDGGQSLTLIGANSGVGIGDLRHVAPHPTQADTVIVSGRSGTARTTDGGASWQKVFDEGLVHITYDPLRPETLYAVRAGDVLVKSLDGGGSWSNLGLPLPDGTKLLAIVADSLNADGVFVATSAGVFHSTDGGRSWAGLSKGLPDISRRLFPPETHLALTADGILMLATFDGVYELRVP